MKVLNEPYLKKLLVVYVVIVLLKVGLMSFSFVLPDSPTYWAEAIGAIKMPFPHLAFAKLLSIVANLPLRLDLRLLLAEFLITATATTSLFPAYFFIKKHRPEEALVLAATLQFFPPFMFSSLLMREGITHALIAWAVWLFSERREVESTSLLMVAAVVKMSYFPLVLAEVIFLLLERFEGKWILGFIAILGIAGIALADLYIPEYGFNKVFSKEILEEMLNLSKIIIFLAATATYVGLSTIGFTLKKDWMVLKLGMLMVLFSLPFNWAYQAIVKFTYSVDIWQSSLYYGRYLEGALIPFYFLSFSTFIRDRNFIAFLLCCVLALLLFGIDFSANPAAYLALWMNSIWFAIPILFLLLKALSMREDLLMRTILAIVVASMFIGENPSLEISPMYTKNPKVSAFLKAEKISPKEDAFKGFSMMRNVEFITEKQTEIQNLCFRRFRLNVNGEERYLGFKETLLIGEGSNISYRAVSPIECNYFLPTATLVGLFPVNISN